MKIWWQIGLMTLGIGRQIGGIAGFNDTECRDRWDAIAILDRAHELAG